VGLKKALGTRKINVFFDNVGGEALEAALRRLAQGGRIVLCGAISTYNDTPLSGNSSTGPRNYMTLVKQRGRMEGFIVFDYASRYDEARSKLRKWLESGLVHAREDTSAVGLESAPHALRGMFLGTNNGKVVVQVATPLLLEEEIIRGSRL
jgi:NADPH-dependent curcumin reductase